MFDEEMMTTQIYAGVREILAGPEWEAVHVADHQTFFVVAGRFNGKAHAGSRDNWETLAHDLDRIAREQYAELLREAAEEAEADAPVVEMVEPEPAPPVPDYAAELAALKEALAASEAARIKAEEALAEASKPPALEPEHKFPASLDEKLSDYAPVEEVLKTDDLLMMSRDNPMAAEQTVQRLDRMKRKKFFELLNVELAELQQERGGPREDLKRESEIESLLGLFARVGEM